MGQLSLLERRKLIVEAVLSFYKPWRQQQQQKLSRWLRQDPHLSILIAADTTIIGIINLLRLSLKKTVMPTLTMVILVISQRL